MHDGSLPWLSPPLCFGAPREAATWSKAKGPHLNAMGRRPPATMDEAVNGQDVSGIRCKCRCRSARRTYCSTCAHVEDGAASPSWRPGRSINRCHEKGGPPGHQISGVVPDERPCPERRRATGQREQPSPRRGARGDLAFRCTHERGGRIHPQGGRVPPRGRCIDEQGDRIDEREDRIAEREDRVDERKDRIDERGGPTPPRDEHIDPRRTGRS